MRLGAPEVNFHSLEPGMHMEIIDTQTMQVWQTMANVSLEEYNSLDLDDRYRRAGFGALTGWCSWFRSSPDAKEPGPMQTMEFGGHLWSYCAKPMDGPTYPAGDDGPRRLSINKHHCILYRAGTTPHVYSCWPGNAVATTIQRQGKS